MSRGSESLDAARMEAVRRMVEAVVLVRREGGLPYTSGVGARMMTRSELADLGFERFSDLLEFARTKGIIEGTVEHGPGKSEIVLTESALALLPERIRRGPLHGAGMDARRSGRTPGLVDSDRERFVPLRRDLWSAFSYFGNVPREFFYDRANDRVLAFTPTQRPFEPDQEAGARQLIRGSTDQERFVEIRPVDRTQQLAWLREWSPASAGTRLQLEALLAKPEPFDAFLDFIRGPGGGDLRWEWNVYRSKRIIEIAEAWKANHKVAGDIFARDRGSEEPPGQGIEEVRRALRALVDDLDEDTLGRFASLLGGQ